jgi:hypothetical protein
VNSFGEMQIWLRNEEWSNTIEFIIKEPRPNTNKKDHHWLMKHIYVCAHRDSGGKSKYVLKNPDRIRNIPACRAEDGCGCRLTVKTYPDTSNVLGLYIAEHSHPVGNANVIYTRIPVEIRAEIERLLRDGMRPEIVVIILFVS